MLSWERGGRWDLHSSGSFTFSCCEAHGKTPLPEELQRSRTSTILPFPNPNPQITWGETHRVWSIVILGLLGNRKSDNFLRRDLLEGRNPSRRSTLYVFPGTALTPDAIHSACRKVFGPPDQRKRVIFLQVGELVQLLLCSQASIRAAATEENDPHSWEEGQGRRVRLPLSPKASCWTGSVLSCNFPVSFSKDREGGSVCRWPQVPSGGTSLPQRVA